MSNVLRITANIQIYQTVHSSTNCLTIIVTIALTNHFIPRLTAIKLLNTIFVLILEKSEHYTVVSNIHVSSILIGGF